MFDWLGDIFSGGGSSGGGIGSALDKIGDFVSNNKKVIGTGLSVYDALQKGDTRDKYAGLLGQQEQERYDQYLNQYGQYKNALEQGYANQQANAAANNAGRSAYLKAHAAAQAAKIAQLQKAKKILKKGKKKAAKHFAPWEQAGLAVLPSHVQATQEGLQGLSLLNAYLQSPENMAKLGASSSPTEIGAQEVVPYLPSHVTGGG